MAVSAALKSDKQMAQVLEIPWHHLIKKHKVFSMIFVCFCWLGQRLSNQITVLKPTNHSPGWSWGKPPENHENKALKNQIREHPRAFP
jgi:hypothetical protein